MLTVDQINQRLNYICGSDSSSICGLSPYKTKVAIWLEKTRRKEQEDISNASYIKFGNYMEDGVAKWFEHESGKELLPKTQELLIHSEHEWMAGNIDFRLKHENAILECKTALSADGWGDNENIIPPHYLMQVAHYCAVGSFDKAYIAVVFTMTREMRWYEYERNLDLEKKLINIEKDFWFNNVLADVAPEPVNEEDILDLYKNTMQEPIIAEPEVIEKIYELKKIKKQKIEIDLKEQECRDKIVSFMKDYDTMIDVDGKVMVTYKLTKSGERFDVKLFSKENPETYKEYLKSTEPQRRLLVKGE
jgi:putative phage-type endonuclease